MILTGTSLRSSKESFALAKGYPDLLYSTAGVHPHDAKTMNEQTIPQLSTLLKEKQVVAVGECGLDLIEISRHALYKSSVFVPNSLSPKRCKSRCSYMSVLPLTDCRDSQGLPPSPKGVVHCFTGSFERGKNLP